MRRFFRFRAPTTQVRALAIVALILVAIFALRHVPPVAAVMNVLGRAGVAVGTAVGNVFARAFQSGETVNAALAQCEDRLSRATQAEAEALGSVQEAEELRALLGYAPRATTRTVAAGIVARGGEKALTVTLDRGSSDGIAVGDAVIVADGQFFGAVTDVSSEQSQVALAQSTQSRVPVAILGSERTIGLAEGQDGSVLRISFIPVDAPIQVGDLVVTSGFDGRLVPHLVVGVITNMVVDEAAPFLSAFVEPLYDARSWTHVLVLTRPTSL